MTSKYFRTHERTCVRFLMTKDAREMKEVLRSELSPLLNTPAAAVSRDTLVLESANVDVNYARAS